MWLTAIGVALSILAVLFFINKPYLMDYVDGALLVDPVKMMKDGFMAAGLFVGFLLG